jgi:hypothetical protein
MGSFEDIVNCTVEPVNLLRNYEVSYLLDEFS